MNSAVRLAREECFCHRWLWHVLDDNLEGGRGSSCVYHYLLYGGICLKSTLQNRVLFEGPTKLRQLSISFRRMYPIQLRKEGDEVVIIRRCIIVITATFIFNRPRTKLNIKQHMTYLR